eukprot:1974213-Amphidinium_carterae.4
MSLYLARFGCCGFGEHCLGPCAIPQRVCEGERTLAESRVFLGLRLCCPWFVVGVSLWRCYSTGRIRGRTQIAIGSVSAAIVIQQQIS